ncbi:hypothetical protein DCC79_06035 [bacterium]|nr:MAG: hypothetical protein DCC79_06035 [bacterium]
MPRQPHSHRHAGRIALAAAAAALSTALASAQPAAPAKVGYPIGQILPDGELVYGPTLFQWDTRAYVASAGGYLARYRETVDGEELDGAGIVQRVAEDYSVGPRLLLALIEMHGGWVRDPDPVERVFPVGEPLPGLHAGLSAAADAINARYYAYRFGGQRSAATADGGAVDMPGTNAASFAVMAYLGRDAAAGTWPGLAAPTRFYAAWNTLFGDPLRFAVGSPPLDAPPVVTAELPFAPGEPWYFTAGPYSPWGAGGPRAAVDFAPPPADGTGCAPSTAWVTAAAAGRVVRSRASGVAVNLGGDPFEGRGWVHVYAHLAAADRVPVGARVAAGDRLGHPSCDGGLSTQSRVAFARKYHGEWVPADDPRAPLVMGGWAALPGPVPGEGSLIRSGAGVRTATPQKAAAVNAVVAERASP